MSIKGGRITYEGETAYPAYPGHAFDSLPAKIGIQKAG